MALSKEDIFKTGPSPEEEKYNTAVELMDAIDCVERFERAVTSLRSDRKSTRLNSSHRSQSRMPSSA